MLPRMAGDKPGGSSPTSPKPLPIGPGPAAERVSGEKRRGLPAGTSASSSRGKATPQIRLLSSELIRGIYTDSRMGTRSGEWP